MLCRIGPKETCNSRTLHGNEAKCIHTTKIERKRQIRKVKRNKQGSLSMK